ncbi:MAG: ArsR family transcriptional regulator [Alphaproteobacteria bacterium]|nr:ArsR family transcriptional regulator [Alphaproteobacteria bacterium]
MSAAYDEHNRKHRRISILLVLEGSEVYRANDSLLADVVNDFGIVSTRDQIRTELLWLKEQGLVTVKEIAGVMVATMTERGSEIAGGRASHPSIARPKPKG